MLIGCVWRAAGARSAAVTSVCRRTFVDLAWLLRRNHWTVHVSLFVCVYEQ